MNRPQDRYCVKRGCEAITVQLPNACRLLAASVCPVCVEKESLVRVADANRQKFGQRAYIGLLFSLSCRKFQRIRDDESGDSHASNLGQLVSL